MATKCLPIVLLLSCLVFSVVSAQRQPLVRTQERLTGSQRGCRIEQLTACEPSQRIQSEGGVTEIWNQEQFQCAGVAPIRNILQPNSLSLPNFSPSPRLVYIQQGRGLVGISNPGCAETYHSRGQQSSRGRQEQQGGRTMQDQHQKVHRVRRGDIVAIPAGVAHWCVNDGNEELVAVSVSDLQSNANQLGQQLRSFYLAGGEAQQSGSSTLRKTEREQERASFQNVLRAFDENMLAEAFGIPVDVVRRMQTQDERGLIVRVQEGELKMIRPDEEEDYEESSQRGRHNSVGVQEAYCNEKISQYLDNPREADVYSRQAGRINTVNMQKLPVLQHMDMSAEKGELRPRAMHAPHWKMNAHSIIYITRGEGQVQVVGHNGNTMFDGRVREGQMIVVPQNYAAIKRAGENGLEWVNIQTNSMPMESPLVGKTSILKGMPIEVLTNSYQMSYKEARDLKYNREDHMKLVPPMTSSF